MLSNIVIQKSNSLSHALCLEKIREPRQTEQSKVYRQHNKEFQTADEAILKIVLS